jgi:translation initiation factor eIF-2B subunit gamma
MPHMLSMPQSGFQALVLCGPGIGLSTFTSIPDEYPKALVSIANRPMVWYVLDWCYRMGVTSKQTLIIFESLFKIS